MPIVSTTTAASRRRKTVIPAATVHDHDADWAALMRSVHSAYHLVSEPGTAPVLFETDAADLYTTFLHHLPAERQTHTCTACRRFVEVYGGLVTITPEGVTQPLFWNHNQVPEFYRASIEAMAGYVSRAKVTGVFLSSDAVWGTPRSRIKAGAPIRSEWTHLSIVRPREHLFTHMVNTDGQARAEKREDYATVQRALAEFSHVNLKEALRILEADAVNRAERFVGPVKWLLGLQGAKAAPGAPRDRRLQANRVWRAVATAPAGFCHPRAGVIGSLLEDIAAGLPFEDVRTKFNAKVHGLRYQRPQSAPAAGNIVQAEKLIEKMGIAGSLARRFARLDELELIWSPTPVKDRAPGGGVFSHLKPKGAPKPSAGLTLPRQTMTWDKFRRTVLPAALRMELYVPAHGGFTGFLTAADPDAPNILKWDNKVSSYVYHNGSPAGNWGLRGLAWCDVTGVALRANMWGAKPMPHLGEGGVFVLKGAVDSRSDQGNALFPETLRDELHAVRSTIEAYSKTAVISGREEASACGVAFGAKHIGVRLHVTTEDNTAEYEIDRWD